MHPENITGSVSRKKDSIISEKIEILENKVDMILDILQNDVTPRCNKMGNHIDFIETVYDHVKSPLHFICDRFHNRSGNYLSYSTPLQEDAPALTSGCHDHMHNNSHVNIFGKLSFRALQLAVLSLGFIAGMRLSRV